MSSCRIVDDLLLAKRAKYSVVDGVSVLIFSGKATYSLGRPPD